MGHGLVMTPMVLVIKKINVICILYCLLEGNLFYASNVFSVSFSISKARSEEIASA